MDDDQTLPLLYSHKKPVSEEKLVNETHSNDTSGTDRIIRGLQQDNRALHKKLRSLSSKIDNLESLVNSLKHLMKDK